jgi:hypothetical protein
VEGVFFRRRPSIGVGLNNLEKVQAELNRYRHPLVLFQAQDAKQEGSVEVFIQARDPSIGAHTYTIHLAPRDLENPRFPWAFQKILYDSLHDFLIEMFIDRP